MGLAKISLMCLLVARATNLRLDDSFAPIEERVLGPQHPNTLAARSHRAFWTGAAGDAAASRDQYAALVPIHERVLGPEHPAALTARANLAFHTGKAGDVPAARDQYATLLPMFERVLGLESPCQHRLIPSPAKLKQLSATVRGRRTAAPQTHAPILAHPLTASGDRRRVRGLPS